MFFAANTVSCEVLTLRAVSGILPSMFFVFASRFVHAAFSSKSDSEKSCHGEQIYAKQEIFSDLALRSVNDSLTVENVFERTAHINNHFKPFFPFGSFFNCNLVFCRNSF